MPYPSPPTLAYSYWGFQQSQGGNTFPGMQIDNDLAGLRVSIEQVIDAWTGSFTAEGILKPGKTADTDDFDAAIAEAEAFAAAAEASASSASTLALNAANSASAAATSAALFPAITATQYLRANAAGTAWETRTAAQTRTDLGLVIGTNVQAFHANLTAFAGLSLVADRLPYADGTGTLALATLTAAARTVLDDTTVAAMLTTLGGVPLAGGTMTGALSTLTLTATQDLSGNSGNQAVLVGAQSGQSPVKPVALRVASGSTDTNVGVAVVPKGTGGFSLAIPDGTSAGGNARGATSVDLQMTRSAAASVASGADSFAAGKNNTASGASSVTVGQNNIASATGSVAVGSGNTMSGVTSLGAGNSSSDRGINGSFTFAGSRFVSAGDAQTRETVHMVTTAAASAVRLTTDNAAAAAANVLVLPNNSAYLVSVVLVARDVTAGTAWAFTLAPALIYRGANAAATVAGTGNPTFQAGPTANTPAAIGTVPTLTADTTLGAVNISFTPPAGNTNTIRVVAWVRTVEVV